MPITLKIVSYQRLTPGQQGSFQTDLDRFSIGRNADNHWTLPDPQRFMSGTHCWMEKRNGNWFITDTSTNGVFINGSKQRLEKNEPIALKHADRIRLGDYDLEADLQANTAATGAAATGPAAGYDDPFLAEFDDIADSHGVSRANEPAPLKDVNTPLAQLDDSLLGGRVSIDKLYRLDEGAGKKAEPPSLAQLGNQASPLRQHFSAPQVQRQQPDPQTGQIPSRPLPDKYAANLDQIPDNWDEETGRVKKPLDKAPDALDDALDQEPAATPAPVFAEFKAPPALHEREPTSSPGSARLSAPQGRAGSAMAAFAAGADLDLSQLQVQDEVDFFHNIGALLHVLTEGLMQAVASRGQVKSEFRIEQTRIAPNRNNPLKFSASVREALSRLLNQTDSAYLSGTAAAAEAIGDVNTHQMAVLAGTEAALKSVLRRFNPATLESTAGSESLMGKTLPMAKKARYWENYKILYDQVSAAADDDFQQFFGAEFSRAYEKQLDRIKTSRKE